ncbi:MAG: type II toxin-antitoxin system VapC family toxin [Anaerolineales bacterium]|nr:type II toxin-antitoxin system VapC family toxin [Anaerolineales bacterium]
MNNFSTVCVDANVVTQRVVSNAAENLWETWAQSGVRLVAPTLLYYEVTNSLYRYLKAGIFTFETIEKTLRAATALPIELIGEANIHQRAKDLAAKYNLPAAYDAHYLALAEHLAVELWTADARLFNTVHSFGVEWVKLVEK